MTQPHTSMIPRPLARLVRPLLLLSLLGLSLNACTDEIEDPDGDDKRPSSVEIQLGQVVTDTIDPPEDTLDWKIVHIPSPGYLTVAVFWDDPSITGVVEVVDKYGVSVREIPRNPDTDNDQITILSETATFYFVKVESTAGKSVYSIRTEFAAGEGNEDIEPIPELDRPIEPGTEVAEAEAPKKGGGGGGGEPQAELPPIGGGTETGGAGAGTTGTPAGGNTPAGPTATPPSANGGLINASNPVAVPKSDDRGSFKGPSAKIEDIVEDFKGPSNPADGSILRVIPKTTGGTEITIDIGSSKGVQINHVGEIIMSDDKRLEGGRFVVTEVFPSSAKCTTNAPANQVTAAKKITVKVPK